VHLPSLVTGEFVLFIKSQFTAGAPDILHLNARTALYHSFKVPAAVTICLTGVKNIV
jgi:hypothetical protein